MKTILESGLIIGLADGIAVISSMYLTQGTTPVRVFQYVASGALGSEAFKGGVPVVLLGICFHLFIAVNFTALFYLAVNKQKRLLDRIYLHGALYGVGIWMIMNFIVVPFSRISQSPFETSQVLVGLLIHIFVIGIPIAVLTKKSFVRE